MLLNGFHLDQGPARLAYKQLIIRPVGQRIKAETQQYSVRKKHVT
jgi:hypothetical protein